VSSITRVLVVDDETQNTEIMSEILSFHHQYEYRIAHSGEDSLAIMGEFFPDIVLLDIMMPGIDGYEVCRRVRASEKNKLAKIIMVSGLSMIGDRLKGYEAGADDYISKPFVEDELLAKIAVYSKLSRMEEVDSMKKMALNVLNHETRTPLNGIILGSELLQELPGLTDDAMQYARLVKESGIRIQEVVDRISRYCSLQDGVQLALKDDNVRDVMDEMVADCQSKFVDCTFTLKMDEEIVFLGDWILLKEALTYVIDNSAKNNKEHGVILIQVDRVDGGLSIRIEDEGNNLEPSQVDKMFEGLFIPDPLSHDRGIGLSLAISKEIIENHGGAIRYMNGAGRGGVFVIDLKRLELQTELFD
jgi:two-component system sensor histidine kinase/response regulator